MPTKPGDNKLRPKDAAILERYRDKIDPGRLGVAFANWAFYSGEGSCCVCGGTVFAADGREFYLKPYTQPVELERVKGVCGRCCKQTQEEDRICKRSGVMYYPIGSRGCSR